MLTILTSYHFWEVSQFIEYEPDIRRCFIRFGKNNICH